jgi:uncharacterized protein with HEPN domain
MKDDAVYLRHILECIQRIEVNTAAGKEAFLQSHVLHDATLRNLQTMSESTQRLSNALKSSQPQIPWPRIAGFRNIIVHHYLDIDLSIVWAIVETDLPPLKHSTAAMLRQITSTEP